MADSPTIVVARLSDDELKKSIESLKTTFESNLKDMVGIADTQVKAINDKLKGIKLETTNSGGSADKGSTKNAKAIQEDTQATETNIKAKERQVKTNKEVEMSFDQIRAGIRQATRVINDYETKMGSGRWLPSSEDTTKYEQSLKRISEYQQMLSRSALSMADANAKAFAFDAKRNIADLTSVDERLKQMNKYYADLEKQSQKTSASVNKQLEEEVGRRSIAIEQMRAFYKEQERASKESAKIQNQEFREKFRGALSMPVNNITEAHDKIERLKALLEEMRAKKKDNILGITEADINRVSNSISKLGQQIDKDAEKRIKATERENALREKMERRARESVERYQTKALKDAFGGAMTMPANTVDEIRAKIERLSSITTTLRKEGLIDESKANRAIALVAQLNEQLHKQVTTEKEAKAVQAQQAQPQFKSARDSYIAFMQGYKDQANQLAQLIQKEENRLIQAQLEKLSALGQRIDQNKSRIQELRGVMTQLTQEMNNAPKQDRAGYAAAIRQTKDEILQLENANKRLIAQERQINQADPLKQQGSSLEELRAKHERMLNIMREETNAQQQTTQAAQSYSEQVQKIASEIRASAQWQKQDALGFRRGIANIDGRSIPVSENTKEGLVLEEQIQQAIQRVNEEKQKSIQLTQQQTQVSQQQAEADRKAAEMLGWNEEKRARRKTYVAPSLSEMSELRYALQQITGSQERWIDKVNKTKMGYHELATYIQDLKRYYLNIPISEKDTKNAKVLAREIQQAEREMAKWQKTLSRPVSLKDALGNPEKTLDDIAYKIKQLQSYKSGLNLYEPKQSAEIHQVDLEINRLTKDMNRYMATTKQVNQANTVLGRSWSYMKNRLAFYFTVGASTAFIKSLIDVRGQYELLERSIGILIDSAQNGSKIFAELNAMAIKSPFTTMELGAAAKQLVAYDVAAKDVVDTTRRLADMAAAVGIPIERLTYALGQIKAYGYLNARDARMFANAGIPLVKELADRYTELEGRLVSTADVYDRIKKKAISYEDVMETVNKMTDEGGKFFNFQEKAADTLKVKIANLTLAYNNMLNEMGKEGQGVIGGGLIAIKKMFEHWRDINNAVTAVVSVLGVYKALQLSILILTSRTLDATRALAILQTTFGAKFGLRIASIIAGIGNALKLLIANPATMAITAITGLAVALAKCAWDYKDLAEANKQFNKSIADGAQENIDSIDKFFEDYKKQLDNIGSLSNVDAQKLWERIQEEIEKTTKNAENYLRVLNKIQDVSGRIKVGEEVLEQTQEIERELKRLAERGMFDTGGGFADDPLADNVIRTTEYVNKLIKKYGTLEEARKKLAGSSYSNDWKSYKWSLKEEEKELDNFVAKLNNLDITKIMGDSGDTELMLANIRSAASTYRDFFLATEKGQKITTDGQARINGALDRWIAKQAEANGLLREEGGVIDVNRVKIEENRTAWEQFFTTLTRDERKRLDYLIKTNQTGSKDFLEIWDNATKRMAEQATSSYNLIQDQIADLRKTPDIVIRVVYQSEKPNLDEQQQAYTTRYITPKDAVVRGLTADQYLEEEKANNEKYGRFMKKQGEDNVEWEKRLGEEYQKNAKAIKSLNDQLAKSAHLSDVDKKAKQDDLKTLQDQQKVLEEVENTQGFNFDQSKKGGGKGGSQKDPLGDAIQKSIQYIGELRNKYEEYRKEGLNANNALTEATKEYGKSITRVNGELAKFGIIGLNGARLATMSLREVRDYYQGLLEKAKGSAKATEALEKAVMGLNGEIIKFDQKTITDSLNSELSKLKDEYELAIALDADPEMGNLFANWWGLNLEELPHTAMEYGKRLTKALNEYLNKKDTGIHIDGNLLEMSNEDLGFLDDLLASDDISKEAYDFIVKNVKAIRDVYKKETEDIAKGWNSLIEKYGGLQAKLEKIYKDTVKEQVDIIKKFGDSEQSEQGINIANQIYITEDAETKARLQKDLDTLEQSIVEGNPLALKVKIASENEGASKEAKAYWDDFKNSKLYTKTFENLDNLSRSTIDMMVGKLENLKDKVKESPEAVKAVMKAMDDLRERQIQYDPIGNIVKSIGEWIDASKRVKEAKRNLEAAKIETQNALGTLETTKKSGGSNKLGVQKAQDNYNKALEKQLKAEEDLTDATDDREKAFKKLILSISKTAQTLTGLQNVLNSVADLMSMLGDEDASDAIKAISAALSAMIGIISGVQMALEAIKNSNAWLLAIATALSIIVGMITFLSGQDNKRIDKQISESELAVKRLENAYKNLEREVEHAYGTMIMGAKRVAIENKKLQLAELRRQLVLENSRSGKKYDAEKVEDLRGQIIDLENEIKDAVEEITNDMLGISSIGDAMENLMDGFIDALRSGEDAMESFNEGINEMIVNMIKKMIVSKYIQPWAEEAWNETEALLNKKVKQSDVEQKAALQNAQTFWEHHDTEDELAEMQRYLTEYRHLFTDDELNRERSKRAIELIKQGVRDSREAYDQALWDIFKDYYDADTKAIQTLEKKIRNDSTLDVNDIDKVVDIWDASELGLENIDQVLKAIMERYGLMKDNANDLSALQQGIQGISEETGSALEAITNGMSQQVYFQSDLLTQIRDAVVAIDSDTQMSIQSQMLLQMQNNYQVMQTMRIMMEGWTIPSGQGIRVELVN